MTHPAPLTIRTSRATWPAILVAAALIAGCLLLAIKAVDIARYDAAILRFPFQVDDAEGVVLAEAALITEGTDPYAHQPSPAPYFYAGPYTPLYTLLNAGAVALAGPTFKFGRATQLLATLVVSGWLVWAVRRTASGGLGWLVGAFAGGLFATAHLVAVWSVRVRPDMTALAWNLLGVAVLHAWLDPEERITWRADRWPRGSVLGRLALGAALFALGWWTKQTFLAVPVAFIVVVALARPRVAATLAALYACFIAAPFIALTALTDGGFAQKTVGYQGSWEWGSFQRLAAPFVARYGLLLIVAVIAAVALCLRSGRPTFAACWLVLSGLLTLGAGTSGGNHNHFVEFVAAASLVIGQALVAMTGLSLPSRRSPLHRQKNLPTPRSMGDGEGSGVRNFAMAVIATTVILLLSVVSFTEREGRTGWLAREYRQPTTSERDGLRSVASYLANVPGPVYSNNVGILVVARQPVRVTDPFTMAAEVRLGRWDDADLVADVAAGRYSAIALSYNDVAALDPDQPPTDATPGLIRAIQTRYRLVERNVLWLYVPK